MIPLVRRQKFGVYNQVSVTRPITCGLVRFGMSQTLYLVLKPYLVITSLRSHKSTSLLIHLLVCTGHGESYYTHILSSLTMSLQRDRSLLETNSLL